MQITDAKKLLETVCEINNSISKDGFIYIINDIPYTQMQLHKYFIGRLNVVNCYMNKANIKFINNSTTLRNIITSNDPEHFNYITSILGEIPNIKLNRTDELTIWKANDYFLFYGNIENIDSEKFDLEFFSEFTEGHIIGKLIPKDDETWMMLFLQYA